MKGLSPLSETLLASAPCDHRGWALWLCDWVWWCGNCGVTRKVLNLAGRKLVTPGDIVRFAV